MYVHILRLRLPLHLFIKLTLLSKSTYNCKTLKNTGLF